MKITNIYNYFKASYKMDIKKTIAYPTSFWLIVIMIPFYSVIQIVFVEAIYQRTNNFLGYSHYEAYILFGTFRIVQSTGYFFFSIKLQELKHLLRGGGNDNFDNVLMRPIDSQLYATLGKLNLGNISPMIVGVFIVMYGIIQESVTLSPIGILGYILLIVMGTLIMYFTLLFLTTLIFWFEYLHVTEYFWDAWQDFGQYPTKLYQGPLGIIMNIVIPITLMAAIPSDYLLGRLPMYMVGVYGLIIVILFLFTRWFWKRSVKKYSSFSS